MSTKREPLLSVSEVADEFGVSIRTVRTMIAAGELPTVRVRHAVRFRQADIRAFIDRIGDPQGPRSRR
ncbi:MAG TPA: helix-turn-helix domain-containing protein [Pirellulales bacterium]|nr:helix-turn-helix domain-containing protein [Pirellulales bacterium]